MLDQEQKISPYSSVGRATHYSVAGNATDQRQCL